jgi:hypothetical protein
LAVGDGSEEAKRRFNDLALWAVPTNS